MTSLYRHRLVWRPSLVWTWLVRELVRKAWLAQLVGGACGAFLPFRRIVLLHQLLFSDLQQPAFWLLLLRRLPFQRQLLLLLLLRRPPRSQWRRRYLQRHWLLGRPPLQRQRAFQRHWLLGRPPLQRHWLLLRRPALQRHWLLLLGLPLA